VPLLGPFRAFPPPLGVIVQGLRARRDRARAGYGSALSVVRDRRRQSRPRRTGRVAPREGNRGRLCGSRGHRSPAWSWCRHGQPGPGRRDVEAGRKHESDIRPPQRVWGHVGDDWRLLALGPEHVGARERWPNHTPGIS
jgi:hypothetical protein